MTTAICRYLVRRGFRVAPFKAQNMSNNSYPCVGGGEIGRAQVAQAEACRLEPSPEMNPILLKPNADNGSQVVLHGKVWRTLRAREYYEHLDYLKTEVLKAYERLADCFEYIVIEGAGSVAEMNLKSRDLVNLNLAREVGARGLLVSDIDRGGVFASIIGTYCLLGAEDQALLRSFAVNRFRGDRSLFDDGIRILEERSGRPCLGVFPMADIHLDAEDGVALDDASDRGDSDIAIVQFPRISNLTDFRLMPEAVWVRRPMPRKFRFVFLPGTKNTIADLRWLREAGLADWVSEQHEDGATVVGICGGYQMLGESVEDPHGVESGGEEAGLGLLPVRTVMQAEKTTQVVEAELASGVRFTAYEIHMGESRASRSMEPFANVNGVGEGVRCGRIIGTYLHGALENAAVLSELLGRPVEPGAAKEESYERLADWFEESANVELFEELYL